MENCRSISTKSYHVDSVQVNVPIRLQSEDQEAVISPEDYIIGDLDGVVCLPKRLAAQAVALLASQADADKRIAEDIEKGKTFFEASKEHRALLKKPNSM